MGGLQAVGSRETLAGPGCPQFFKFFIEAGGLAGTNGGGIAN